MFEQQKLGYSYDALEPFLDALTMETHYSKHHAAYTKNLNAALENAGIRPDSIEKLLSSLDEISDEAVRKAVRNNGGGFYNHNIYFQSLSPEKHREPVGKLADAIRTQLGGTDSVKEAQRPRGLTLWIWLGLALRKFRREASAFLQRQSGQSPDGGKGLRPDPRDRCLGARLLPEVQKPPGRLCEGLLGGSRLGKGQ